VYYFVWWVLRKLSHREMKLLSGTQVRLADTGAVAISLIFLFFRTQTISWLAWFPFYKNSLLFPKDQSCPETLLESHVFKCCPPSLHGNCDLSPDSSPMQTVTSISLLGCLVCILSVKCLMCFLLLSSLFYLYGTTTSIDT
jgi:hypothetical protein